jgi:hypothetical protein
VSKLGSRRSPQVKSKRSRLKALPWAALLQAALAFGERWRALSEKDRTRLTQLVRQSRGRVGNLSARDRDELRKVVRKLDLRAMGREMLPLVRGGRRKRR